MESAPLHLSLVSSWKLQVMQKEVWSQVAAAYVLGSPEMSHQFQVGDSATYDDTEPLSPDTRSSLEMTVPGAVDHPDGHQVSALTNQVVAVGAES